MVSAEQLVFICTLRGLYERVQSFVTDEVSLVIMSNQCEPPAMIMIDATARLIPEVSGKARESIVGESHPTVNT